MSDKNSVHNELKRLTEERDLYARLLEEANLEFEEKIRELSLLRKIGDVISNQFDLESLCRNMLDIIIKETNAENCSLLLKDHNSDNLILKIACGIQSKTITFFKDIKKSNIIFSVGEGVAGKVALEGKPILIDDANNDRRFDRSRKSNRPIGSLLCCPLIVQKQVIGVINLSNSKAHAFRHSDMRSIIIFSAFASSILSNAISHIELKQSEEKYHSLIEHANDAILSTNIEGVITSFNKKAEEIFGYAREEVVGKSVTLLSSPSERERQKKLLVKFNKTNELYIVGKTMEGKGIKKNGQEFSYEGSTFTLELKGESFLTVILRDISERKKKEEELIQIKTALDNSSDAIAMMDVNLKIVYQNQSFQDLFGYTVDEIDGKGIPNVYKDVDVADKALQVVRSGGRWRGEIRTLSKDGRKHTCLLSTSPILDDKGNVIGYFSIHTDITDRKQMEHRFLQSEKLKALGELAGGVAHDFNNVLAAILGRAQLLKRIVEPPPGKEERRKSVLELKNGLEVIEQASLDGAETVRRIQEFARRRDDDKYFTTVDINKVIENSIDFTKVRWKNEAESKGIKIDIQKDFSTLPTTAGSAAELREVFTNIMRNAVDAMPQGGTISIKTFKKKGSVFVKVKDTGIGIPPSLRERIFDPFFTTKGPQSSGLGMSVSYGIIHRHRGTIKADSMEGKGTTFTIKLPISERVVVEEKEKPILDEQRKAHILVIEDEKQVRDLLSSILTMGGHEVRTASDGSGGIEMFEKKEFDLVFTDLGMPGMSGWQVAEKVKSINGRIPVAIITGWNVELKESELKERWVDLIIQKPFEVDEILRLVQEGMILRDRFKAA